MKLVFNVKRYALALYEVAEERGVLDNVYLDIELINNIVNGNDEIRKFCLENESCLKAGDFVNVLKASNFSDIVLNFLNVVASNNRLYLLPFFKEAYDKILSEKNGQVELVFESATIPDENILSLLSEKFKKKLGASVKITVKHNKTLIKGFRVFYGDRLIDNSVLGRIREMKKVLK